VRAICSIVMRTKFDFAFPPMKTLPFNQHSSSHCPFFLCRPRPIFSSLVIREKHILVLLQRNKKHIDIKRRQPNWRVGIQLRDCIRDALFLLLRESGWITVDSPERHFVVFVWGFRDGV